MDELTKPPNIPEDLWVSLTTEQKKFVVEHEKLHEAYLLLCKESSKNGCADHSPAA